MAKVELIASDEKANATVTDAGADTERLFRDYARLAEMLGLRGAQAIVIPEKLGVMLEDKAAGTDYSGEVQRSARRCAAIRQAPHLATPRVEPEAGDDADGTAA
jgi:apolipoprotein N-acyltransferase